MKKNAFSTILLLTFLCLFNMAMAQSKNNATAKSMSAKNAPAKKVMTWTTKSQAALQLAQEGTNHYMNVEYPQAYEKFSAAVKLDPDFTIPLVFMSVMSRGDIKKAYAKKAIKSSANKTEGEKLFASITDTSNTAATNRETWAKLHSMFPDGDMIGYFYTVTRATPEEKFTAAQDYIKQFPDKAPMYNTIAYYYMRDKKDMESAKKHFEKYITLYPDGTNPYDSMAEYYLSTGDKENSRKYYMLSLDKYPYNNSALNALDKMSQEKKMQESKVVEKAQ